MTHCCGLDDRGKLAVSAIGTVWTGLELNILWTGLEATEACWMWAGLRCEDDMSVEIVFPVAMRTNSLSPGSDSVYT